MSAEYNFKEGSRTDAIDNNFYFLLTPQEETTGTSEENFGFQEQIHSDGNNFAVLSESYELIGKRKASSDQLITDGTDYPEQSKSKICRMSDQGISTSCEQDGIEQDYFMDMNSTSQNVVERNCSTNMNQELSRIEESHSRNHGKQFLDILSNKETFIIAQNTASNVNVPGSIRSSNNHSDSGTFEGKTAFSIDAIHSVPGPSQTSENIPQSNLSLENVKYGSPLNPQTAIEAENEHLMCWGCDKEVSSQVKEKEEINQFKYCDCQYHCTVCGVGYFVEGSHEIEHTCNVCQNKFQCKTQLENHYISHEIHHNTYCRLCQTKLDRHKIILGGEEYYKCCQCSYGDWSKYSVKRHLYIHSDLKIFKCLQCGKPNRTKERLLTHFKYHNI